jgi:RHS repeat-associated protein
VSSFLCLGSGASPGALKSVKLVAGATTLSETDYAYDPVTGRLSTITIVGQNGAANQVFNVTYKSGTNLVSGVTAPGSSTAYSYDPHNGRLTSLGTAKTGGASVYSASFGYYNDDQRQTDTVSRTNANGSTDSYQTTYGYDAADELISADTTGTGGPIGSWSYDGVGNRTNFAGTPNNLNQYANYTYNARGDCTSDGTWNYSYDALDRVTAAVAVNGSAKVTFGYDAESRLTETDTWSPNGSGGWTLASTTRYAWDGGNLLAEFDGNNNLLRSFAYGPTGLLGITDYTSGSPVTYVPVMDATGSIVQLLDTSGNVVADFHYDAWGVRTASGPAAGACPFGFAGMFQDPTTGLYYAQARWYSAPQGRFLTRDPAGESGGLNLYAYCGNDPVNQADPTGLDPQAALTPIDFNNIPVVTYVSHQGGLQEVIARHDATYNVYVINGFTYRIFRGEYSSVGSGAYTPESEALFAATLQKEQAYWAGQGLTIDPTKLVSRDGGNTVFWPAIVPDAESQATVTKALSPTGQLLEPSAADKMIPVWGSFKSFLYDLYMGNYGEAIVDGAMTALDIVGVVIGVQGLAKFGAGLIAELTGELAEEQAAAAVARSAGAAVVAANLEMATSTAWELSLAEPIAADGEFAAASKWGRGGSDPGPVTWVNGSPSYDPDNYKLWIAPGQTPAQQASAEAHELAHIDQFSTEPWKVWYAQTWLPGSSIPMYSLEAEAYAAQAKFLGESYRAWMPFQSANMQAAATRDTIYFVGGAGLTGWYLLHGDK